MIHVFEFQLFAQVYESLSSYLSSLLLLMLTLLETLGYHLDLETSDNTLTMGDWTFYCLEAQFAENHFQ